MSARLAGERCGRSRPSADQQVDAIITRENHASASKARHLSFGEGSMCSHSLKHMAGKRDRRPEAKVLDSSTASRFCQLLSRPIAVRITSQKFAEGSFGRSANQAVAGNGGGCRRRNVNSDVHIVIVRETT